MSTPGEQPLVLVRCPQCGADLAAEQDWCLNCGAPARTRIAPTPNWRVPALAAIAALLIAGGGIAYAFVKLSDDNGPVTTTSATATEPLPDNATVPPVSVPAAAAVPATGATGAGPAAAGATAVTGASGATGASGVVAAPGAAVPAPGASTQKRRSGK